MACQGCGERMASSSSGNSASPDPFFISQVRQIVFSAKLVPLSDYYLARYMRSHQFYQALNLAKGNLGNPNQLVYKVANGPVIAHILNLEGTGKISQERTIVVATIPNINQTITCYLESNELGLRISHIDNGRIIPLIDTNGGSTPTMIDCQRYATTYNDPLRCAGCLWWNYGSGATGIGGLISKAVARGTAVVSFTAALVTCIYWNQDYLGWPIAYNEELNRRNNKRPYRGISTDLYNWSHSWSTPTSPL